jgi:hypothetical protein
MNNNITMQQRAICPMCRQEMVYTVISTGFFSVWAWICNCRQQPEHMLADIENARLVPGGTLCYRLEIQDAEPTTTGG